MDNFRRYKAPKRGPTGSVDGFASAHSTQGSVPTKQFNRSYRSSSDFTAVQTGQSDSGFDRAEGFHPSTIASPYTAAMAEGSARTYEQVGPSPVLESADSEEAKEKRRSFRQRRKEKRAAKNRHMSRKDRRKRIAKRAGIATLIVVLLVGAGLGYVYMKVRSIFKGDAKGAIALQENPDPKLLNGEGDGRVNILIMGKGGPTQTDGPDLTDTLLLASIDPVQKEAALLSVPRDLWVRDNGSQTKINAVYKFAKDRYLNNSQNRNDTEGAERAGTKALMDKVSEVLGVPMHYYVMVDFTAFQKAIDTVGGITIDVKNPVREQMLLNGRPYYLNVATGTQNFDGLKALAYARCRHCDNRSDFGRAERQREIIIALKDKILSSGTYANPYKIQQLVSTFGSNVRTDIGTDELGRLFEIGKEIPSDKIASVSLVDEPNVLLKTGPVGNQSVVMPIAGLFDYSEIQSFVRNKLKDSFLNSENARIVILNGTKTAGLAAKTTKELQSYGYNITKTANAPTQDYVNTYVVDLTNGANKYTQSYLEKRMQVTATSQLPDSTIDVTDADFVIIIGQNEANRQQN